jgi:hypothetical protein
MGKLLWVVLILVSFVVGPLPAFSQTVTDRNVCAQTADAQAKTARNTWTISAKKLAGDVNKEYANRSAEFNSNNQQRISAAGRQVRGFVDRAYQEYMTSINEYQLAIQTWRRCIGIENAIVQGKYVSAYVPAYEAQIQSCEQSIGFINQEASQMRQFWSGYQWF